MNRLAGTIVEVQRCGSIALIDVNAAGHRLTATLVGGDAEVNGEATAWQPGAPVLLLFAETEVALAKNLTGLISMRNRLPCRLVSIAPGSVLTKVVLEVGGHILTSVITSRSAQRLSLAAGDIVEALIKANDMHVVAAPPPAQAQVASAQDAT